MRDVELPSDWRAAVDDADPRDEREAVRGRDARRRRSRRSTRWRRSIPELFGGSADLTGSNNTNHKGSTTVSASRADGGNYLHYGVREFGMAAIMNGIALHRRADSRTAARSSCSRITRATPCAWLRS